MQNLKLAFCLLVGGIAIAFFQIRGEPSVSASQPQDKSSKPKPEDMLIGCSVIDPLDDCIQELFSKADYQFGMARMPTTNKHLNQFNPRNDKEKAIVKDLDDGGWLVAFYLAGRWVLGEKPSPAAPRFADLRHSMIGGPIAITPEYLTRGHLNKEIEMPEPDQFWDDSQKALRAFETKDRYEFSIGKWKIEARPIRARETCLKCHNNNNQGATLSVIDLNHAPSQTPIKVGDALGVAMYAYTRKK